MEKPRRKFVIIAKIDSTNFVKYRSNNIESFIKFLIKKYPGTRFANIYSNRGPDKGKLLGTYGSKKGLCM